MTELKSDEIILSEDFQAGSEHIYYNLLITRSLSPPLAEQLKKDILDSLQLKKKLEVFLKEKYALFVNNPEHTPEWKLLEEISNIIKGDKS